MEVRNVIINRLVKYAVDTLKLKRGDVQAVATWQEARCAAEADYRKGTIERSFNLIYKPFSTRWETIEEEKLLDSLNMEYRQWTSSSKAPKGFVGKLFSKLLTDKRRDIYWVTRRQLQEIDETGNKIKRRHKENMQFDPTKHAKCVAELGQSSKKTLLNNTR